MRKIPFAALAVPCAALAACMPPLADEEMRESLPEEADLQVRMGSGDGAAAGALEAALLDPYAACPECCVEGEGEAAAYVTGDLYRATRGAVAHVNGGLALFFGWIRVVVSYPYTSRSGDEYTWGPWSADDTDPLSRLRFRFRMGPQGDGYAFRLEAQNVNEPGDAWEPLAWGDVTKGDAPHRGQGTMEMDFDRLHAMDAGNPSRLHGQVRYEFDVRRENPTAADPNTVRVAFTRFYESAAWGPDPAPFDATYGYWRFEDLAGRLQHAASADVAGPEGHPDGQADSLTVESRWAADGEGRALARIESASIPGFASWQVEECWAGQAGLFYQTWRRDTATPSSGAPWTEETCGAEANCPAF